MALSLAGISKGRPEMIQAREAIFANGGIKATRVLPKFSSLCLAKFPGMFVPLFL